MIAAGISASTVTPLGVSTVLAGLFGWEMHKNDKRFFWTSTSVVLFGIFLAATGFNPLTIIMTAQAVNGVFLPIIVIALVFMTSRQKVMGEYKNTPLQNLLGACVGIISLVVGFSCITSLF